MPSSTSLGYGSREDDVTTLANLRSALRVGGLVLIETAHRDLAVANLLRGKRPWQGRLAILAEHA